MKMIFIAGPFRADSDEAKKQNLEQAREYARKFIDNEIPFYSPHLNLDQELIGYPEDRVRFAIEMNHEFLDRCEALAVLPGWEDSAGTREEIEIAKEAGKKIFYLEQESSIQGILDFIE